MSKDLLHFNKIEQTHSGKDGLYYRLPFSVSPVTEQIIGQGTYNLNSGSLMPIRNRIEDVVMNNGYALVHVHWITQYVIVKKPHR